LAGVAVVAGLSSCNRDTPPPVDDPSPPADVSEQVHTFCVACHAYPPPDTFPRNAWREEIERAYGFFGRSTLNLKPPLIQHVVKYYEDRAPEKLPPAKFQNASTPAPVDFDRIRFPVVPKATPPAISNVNLVHLFDDKKLDVLACEMRHGMVLALRPYDPSPTWQVLYKAKPKADSKKTPGQAVDSGFHPAHAELVDLRRDGHKDILVANLGSFSPTDIRCGSLVWLRDDGKGKFTPITLFDHVGRIADVQAADFRGTGKLDLVVAAFGWQQTGEIILLENHTTDWSKPDFRPIVLDERHGTIHVPVIDLNGDGKPDFIALISQEHETIVAFINEGNSRFRKETIYEGPHPAIGSSGIQLVDLNGDGKIDVLYTNGDTLDKPYLLKPYHSVQWLENPGDGTFPWKHHPITPMYGVHRAVAADFTGTGRNDIIAVSFLPKEAFPQRKDQKLDAIIYLEQAKPGEFTRRYSLETISCDHVTCAAGDIFGRGKVDMVTADFINSEHDNALTIWKNLGTRPDKR
jgi:hypothetical protein